MDIKGLLTFIFSSIESKTLNNNVLKVGVESYKMNYDSKFDYLSVSTLKSRRFVADLFIIDLWLSPIL